LLLPICRKQKSHDTFPLIPLFATGVVDTGGIFATGINNTSETGAKFAAGVVDTGGKFATGVVDTGGNFAAGSLIPVVNLDLRISTRISRKFETVLMVYSGAWGKLIHEKNQKQKISSHYPFKSGTVFKI
jgi:hypothetical protein